MWILRSSREGRSVVVGAYAGNEQRARPASAAVPSGERPQSATMSTAARLASPRLVVHASEGWHVAGMCIRCSQAALAEAREQLAKAEQKLKQSEGRAAARSSAEAPTQRAVESATAHAAPAASAVSPPRELTDADGAEVLAEGEALREKAPSPPTVPAGFAPERTPVWLRSYYAKDAAPGNATAGATN